MADFKNRSNVAVAGGVTGNRDLIAAPSALRWIAEGKVFGCGVGAENAGIDSAASLDDTTPTFALIAPSSANLYVVPLLVRISTHTEGGASPKINVALTRAAADCATTLAVTGTAFTAKQNLLAGDTSVPQSSLLYTCTASALTNADYVSMELAQAADNPITGTGGIGWNKGTTYELGFYGFPPILRSGAGLLVYCYTGTTDTKHIPYIVFAELSIDDMR